MSLSAASSKAQPTSHALNHASTHSTPSERSKMLSKPLPLCGNETNRLSYSYTYSYSHSTCWAAGGGEAARDAEASVL